jgi:hypothetical protein
LHVHDYLNETFPWWWIGRGSEASPAPFAWPPRSPDLTTLDNALWGFIKESAKCGITQQKCYRQLSKKPSLTWPWIIWAKHLPQHAAEFNCARTMKVSVPMFWTLTPSDTCPYQALNHNRYSVENKGGGGMPTSWPPRTFTFIYCLFNSAVSSSGYIVLNRMINKRWIWMDVEEVVISYFKRLSWHLSGGCAENRKKKP